MYPQTFYLRGHFSQLQLFEKIAAALHMTIDNTNLPYGQEGGTYRSITISSQEQLRQLNQTAAQEGAELSFITDQIRETPTSTPHQYAVVLAKFK